MEQKKWGLQLTHTTSNNKQDTAIKVLHLVEYLYLGGIETFLAELARILPRNLIKQSFFAYEMDEFSGVARDMKENGEEVYIYKKSVGHDSRLLQVINHIVREQKINIIHTHDFGPVEYAVRLKLLNPKIKLIHTQHTLHHFINNFKYKTFFQFASYFYSTISVVSDHVSEMIKAHCKWMKRISIVINNGVDVDKYSSLTVQQSNKKILNLVTLSRISPEKNLIYILKVCHILKSNNRDFILHHAGSGPQSHVQKIFDYIREYNLSDNIKMHGFIKDVREILQLGDIFISSSKTEGHPIAVLEAMAAKRLCLCSDIPAHKDLCKNGIILFDIEDPYALSSQLMTIQDNMELYKNHVDISASEVRIKYDIHQMAKKYCDTYYTMCANV